MRAMRGCITLGRDRVLDPRLRYDALREVEWYFQWAESEMSAPSNFGRMLASVSLEGDRRSPEDQVEAASAYRRIRGWLHAMPNSEAGVLQAAYEPRDWPADVRTRFRHLTGIAVRLMSSLATWPEERQLQEAMDRAHAYDLGARCVEKEAKFLERLRGQAEARLESAVGAYVAVRGTGRSVLPSSAWGAFSR